MSKKILFSIFLFIFVGSQMLCAAEIDDSAGKSGAKYLLIPVGVGPTAMGEAYVAVSNDVNAIFWNPGGLSLSPDFSITAMHYEWFQDIRYDFLGYSRPIGYRNAIGFFAGGLYTGDDLEHRTGIDDDGPMDMFSTGDYYLGLTFSRELTKSISAGLTGKGLYQKIDTDNATGLALDFGLHVHPPSASFLKFGLNIQNVGPKMKFKEEAYDLPMNIKAGLAMVWPQYGFTFAADVNKPNDNKLRINTGMEYWVREIFAFRMGYRYKQEGNDALNDDAEGITVGAGFFISGAEIDYAYVPYGTLGDTHRIGITYSFNTFAPLDYQEQPVEIGEEEPIIIEEVSLPSIQIEEEPKVAEEPIIVQTPTLPDKETLNATKRKAVDDLFASGKYKFQNEMFEDAQIDFEKILINFSGSHRNDEALYMIGQCYFEQGDYLSAITYYQRAVDDETQLDMDADAQLMLGYSYYFKGDYRKAKKEFEKVINNYPNSEAVQGGEASHWVEKCNRYIR